MKKTQISKQAILVLKLLDELLRMKIDNHKLDTLLSLKKQSTSRQPSNNLDISVGNQSKNNKSTTQTTPLSTLPASEHQLNQPQTHQRYHAYQRPPSQPVYQPTHQYATSLPYYQPVYADVRKKKTIVPPIPHIPPSISSIKQKYDSSNLSANHHNSLQYHNYLPEHSEKYSTNTDPNNEDFQDVILDRISDIQSKISDLIMSKSQVTDRSQISSRYSKYIPKPQQRRSNIQQIKNSMQKIRSFNKLNITQNNSTKNEKRLQTQNNEILMRLRKVKDRKINVFDDNNHGKVNRNKILEEDAHQEDEVADNSPEKTPKYIDFKLCDEYRNNEGHARKHQYQKSVYIPQSKPSCVEAEVMMNRCFQKDSKGQNPLKYHKGVLTREKMVSAHHQQLDFIDQSQLPVKQYSKSTYPQ